MAISPIIEPQRKNARYVAAKKGAPGPDPTSATDSIRQHLFRPESPYKDPVQQTKRQGRSKRRNIPIRPKTTDIPTDSPAPLPTKSKKKYKPTQKDFSNLTLKSQPTPAGTKTPPIPMELVNWTPLVVNKVATPLPVPKPVPKPVKTKGTFLPELENQKLSPIPEIMTPKQPSNPVGNLAPKNNKKKTPTKNAQYSVKNRTGHTVVRVGAKRTLDMTDGEAPSWIPNKPQRDAHCTKLLKLHENTPTRYLALCAESSYFGHTDHSFQRFIGQRCANLVEMGHQLKVLSPYQRTNLFLEWVLICELVKIQLIKSNPYWIHPIV